jgi:hypothetical protein
MRGKGVLAQHVSDTQTSAGLEHSDHPIAEVMRHGVQQTLCMQQFAPNCGPLQHRNRSFAHVAEAAVGDASITALGSVSFIMFLYPNNARSVYLLFLGHPAKRAMMT